jgi:hypothetical protein
MNDAPPGTRQSSRLLHLVFGGVLKELHGTEFRNPVDNVLTRYFIVHQHRFLDPASDGT